ncbi:S8 family serine peptidase [Bacillus massilinigeriensis]|uniref:S8 family serine peptidase n=1 Tax=Bacillus mediterraneensis TaxID=1805474 RepID=UPI0008F86216|nr:S8 family serine peptidase [Bacillus mediterraneensis]
MKKKKVLAVSLATMLSVSAVAPGLLFGSTDISANGEIRKSQLTPAKKSMKNHEMKPVMNEHARKLRDMMNKKEKKQEYVKGELIVTYKKSASSSTAKALHSKYSLKKVKSFSSMKSDIVKVPAGQEQAMMKKLKSDHAVASVQYNYKYYPSSDLNTPNYFNELWGLNNIGQPIKGIQGKPDVDIDAPEAWSKLKLPSDKKLVVGVIDTGVDINHPDLKEKIWTNEKEVPDNGIDDDGNGYIDDIHGYDFYNKDNTVYDPLDGDEHGTHVSGTIAARAEGPSIKDNTGVVGVAPNVEIMSLKFLGPEGGDTAGAIEAIEYAKKMGVKLTNNSWGGGEYDELLEKAISESGSLFVAAAGNDSMDNDEETVYPAGYESPNILTVAALNNAGKLADFSNYGATSVDVAAPGENILSTVPKVPLEDYEKKLGNISAAVSVDHTQYKFKSIIDGIGYEKLSEEVRQAAFDAAMNYLAPDAKNGKVLLVQDDEHDLATIFKGMTDTENYFKDYLPIYEKLLSGYNHDKVTLNADDSLPEDTDLGSYDAVVWFTGHGLGFGSNEDTTLTDDDLKLLDAYLKKGGKLLLTGQDALMGQEGSAFVKNLLKLKVHADLAQHMNVKGVEGSIYNGKKFEVDRSESQFPSADFFTSTDASVKPLLKYHTDYSQAYDYYSGTSMATPHVTGAAALFLGMNPDIEPDFAKLYLMHRGLKLDSINGFTKSGKQVKASALDTVNDDLLPGVPFKNHTEKGSLDASTDKNDVYAFDMKEGETIQLSLRGKQGTDFDLYVYGENDADVSNANGLLAHSENQGTSTEKITFTAPETGFYFVNPSAFKGSGEYQLSVGNFGGDYENQSRAIQYEGEWEKVSNAKHSGKSASILKESGEMSFTFVGSSFEWIGFKDATQGLADIYIDGTKADSVSLFSSTHKYQQSLFKKDFGSYGKHHVRIVWTGKDDPAGRKSASGINIDKLIVKSSSSKPVASYQTKSKVVKLAWPATKWGNSYNVYRKEAGGKEYVKLNKAPHKTLSFEDKTAVMGKSYSYAVSVNTTEEETSFAETLFVFDDDIKGAQSWKGTSTAGSLDASLGDSNDVWVKKLEKGKTYRISLNGPAKTDFNLKLYIARTKTVYGTKPEANSSKSGSAESISFTPKSTGNYYIAASAASGAGTYMLNIGMKNVKTAENNALKYSGKWSVEKHAKASGGSLSYTGKKGNAVQYDFTGESISVFAKKDKNSGLADIYIDGKKVKQVDLYSSSTKHQQKVYTASGLKSGKHTIKIVAAGKKNKSSKGTNISVDKLEAISYTPVK